jgi:hypothetical protein
MNTWLQRAQIREGQFKGSLKGHKVSLKSCGGVWMLYLDDELWNVIPYVKASEALEELLIKLMPKNTTHRPLPSPSLRRNAQEWLTEPRDQPESPGQVETVAPIPSPVTITRYGERYWAVFLHGELLAVVMYRKGAERIKEVLEGLLRKQIGQ